jgi:hypothetical protein
MPYFLYPLIITHMELIFMYSVRNCSSFILIMDIPRFPNTITEETIPSQKLCIFDILVKDQLIPN